MSPELARVYAFIEARAAKLKREIHAMVVRDNRSLGQRVRHMINQSKAKK